MDRPCDLEGNCGVYVLIAVAVGLFIGVVLGMFVMAFLKVTEPDPIPDSPRSIQSASSRTPP